MYADVYESAECGDICDDAGQSHAGLEVLQWMDILAEGKVRCRAARVKARFGQFLDDISNGGKPEVRGNVIRCF